MLGGGIFLASLLLLGQLEAGLENDIDGSSDTAEYSFFTEPEDNSVVEITATDGESDNGDEEDEDYSFFAEDNKEAAAPVKALNFTVDIPVKKDKKLPLSFRFNGELGVKGASDILFDQAGEDVSEFQSWGLFTTEARLGSYMRLYSNFAIFWGFRGQAPAADKTYLLFNTSNKRYQGGFDLLETFAEFNFTAGLSLRVGNQLFAWGQNDILPAVSLNPLDGRLAYLNGMKLHRPVPAVSLSYNRRWFTAKLAWLPWFKAHQVALTDKDISLAPAGSIWANKLELLQKVSPTLWQELVDDPLSTDPPANSIQNSTIGLRLEAESKRADFALSLLYGFDLTPRLQFDDNLLFLASRASDLLADPALILTDASLNKAFTGLTSAYNNGATLFKVDYLRQLTVAFDMAWQIWDLILKVDLSFSPQKIFYDADLHYSRAPYLKSALAVEYNYGTSLYLSLSVFAMFTFSNEIVPFLDFKMMTTDSSYLVGFFFMGRKTFLDDRLKIELIMAISATFGDFLLRGTIDYKLRERHVFGLGTTIIHGPEGSLGGRYDNTDNIFTYYRWLF